MTRTGLMTLLTGLSTFWSSQALVWIFCMMLNRTAPNESKQLRHKTSVVPKPKLDTAKIISCIEPIITSMRNRSCDGSWPQSISNHNHNRIIICSIATYLLNCHYFSCFLEFDSGFWLVRRYPVASRYLKNVFDKVKSRICQARSSVSIR